MNQFKRKSGIDISDDKRAMQRLRKQCETAKRTLSTQTSATIDCEALAKGEDFSTTISRAKFEELNVDLFKKTLTPVTQVLKDSGMSKNDVHQVILVGGSTRIPKIQDMLSEFFGGKKLNKSINPDEAVVRTKTMVFSVVCAGRPPRRLVMIICCRRLASDERLVAGVVTGSIHQVSLDAK
jgi:heat shock 70kDa protein 1/2/6/8